MKKTITGAQSFCKEKGFVFPNSLLYGNGLAGVWDYGQVGVELKNNLKFSWWSHFVYRNENIVGIDAAILSKKAVWDASGHTQNFVDAIVKCKKCNASFRADHLIEDELKIQTDGLSIEKMNSIIKKEKILCPNCKGQMNKAEPFNLLFEANIGPIASDDSKAILRPETAQLIFTNFKAVQFSSRKKLPFGIAQIGRAYRNEISPRNFLFRCREFEQMEIEFFLDPADESCKLKDIPEMMKENVLVWTEEMQKKELAEKEYTFGELLKKKIIKEKWLAFWIWQYISWFGKIGIKKENLRIRQHLTEELSHYSSQTFDIEYMFPFGFKEIVGIADRGQFDLTQHQNFSGQSQEMMNNNEKKVIPHCIEPSSGLDRIFLALLFESADTFKDDRGEDYTIMHFKIKIAPVKVAVMPLVNKLKKEAKEVYEKILELEVNAQYDTAGSIGKRYARQDEIGTPFCITFDFLSLEDKCVTLRERDTKKQDRVKIKDICRVLKERL
ncbi:MAG: glycine--tRNA ligase [Candidatus Nanohalarchaeota archaeon]|nr:MAG: glycine--tRNA ligase [Candidatus Nanohaloarchaeota archaeon]